VWYNTGDSPYYVNVKLGSLNAFQTKILGVGKKETVVEHSPLGQHKSNYVGLVAPQGALFANKSFNEHDVLQFHDKSVSPSNMAFAALGSAQVHPKGYIMHAEVDHLCVLKDASPAKANAKANAAGEQAKKETGSQSETGFNINLSSRGVLTHVLASSKLASDGGSRFASKTLLSSRAALEMQPEMARGNMLSVARDMLAQRVVESAYAADSQDVADALQAVVSLPHSQQRHAFQAMKIVAEALRSTKGSSTAKKMLLSPFMRRLDSLDRFARARLLLLCVLVGESDLLVSYGLRSADASVVMQSLMASHHFGFGESSSQGGIPASVRAVVEELSSSSSSNAEIASVARHVLVSAQQQQRNTHTLGGGLDFPFNKSVGKTAKLGGSTLGVTFDGELFAGTNFNCNQPTFNFEARADVTGDAHFMGMSKKAFEALAVYGQKNGSPLADELLVTVFGKTLYHKKFPTLACKGSTYDLAHAAPGFELSYTVWVSIIPITFEVGANLELDLKWDWEICAEQLTAEIGLLPSAGFAFNGGAVIDLLLLKAGVEIKAGLNSVVTPEAYVTGSECEVGFNVTQTNTPMDADFDAYFAWKHCKFLIFDCHWGKHNQKTFWKWDAPSSEHRLLSKSWKIKP
jgi:hypothetical protein